MTRTLKSLAITAALVATLAPAHACDPPEVGDQYKLQGQTFEIAKVNSATCNIKLCVRPVGSRQNCRWIKDPMWTATWIISHGVKQPQ
jgi:hypothetical protein